MGDTKEITTQQKLEVVDKLVKGGVEGVSLLGGEPLTMNKDFFSVVEHAVSKGLKISLVTNGLLLKGKVMERVVESGIDRIVVSLDGASKESHESLRGNNTFEKVVDNIESLTEHIQKIGIPLHVNVNTVLNRLNYPEIDKLIDLCLKLRVNEWALLSLVPIGFAEDNLSNLAITPEEEIEAARIVAQRYCLDRNVDALTLSPLFVYPLIWDYIEQQYGLSMPKSRICCNASISLGFIGPDGNLYPCDRVYTEHYVGRDIGNAKIRAMSLVDHSFYEIWNSDHYINMFEFILSNNTYRYYTPCNHCKYLKTRYCNPCPLYSLDSKMIVRSCQIVEKALGDISGADGEASFINQMLTSESKRLNDDKLQSGKAFEEIVYDIPEKQWGIRCFGAEDLSILLNPYTVEFMGLNLMGKTIWELIDGKNTVSDIASTINEVAIEIKDRVFQNTSPRDADYELQVQMNRKVSLFLETLHKMGFITWCQKENL